MDTTSVVTQSSTFDHQQVAKNKRKKFNPQYMLKNSGSEDEDGVQNHDDRDDDDDGDQSSNDEIQQANALPITNFSITKNQKNRSASPSPSALNAQTINPFLSPSKFSLLQTFNLQQQQQLLQQAAISAIAPQFSQQLNSSMNLSETEAKFREFAFKTMQELLSIYGLSLPPSEILDAMKNQQISEYNQCLVDRTHIKPKIVPHFCNSAFFMHEQQETWYFNFQNIFFVLVDGP